MSSNSNHVMKLSNSGHLKEAEFYFRNKSLHPSERWVWDIPIQDEVGTMFLWYHREYPSSRIPKEVKEYYKKTVSSSRINPDDPLLELVNEQGYPPIYVSKIVEYPSRGK